MARDRYPSDERRLRQRPHVKVHLSWPTHPRYGRAYADRDIRAIVLGVWMLAARAHASATGDRVTLGPDQIAETCACRRPDVALTWLRRACHVMGWSLEYDGHVAVIEVRNFARKQGFRSADGGDSPPTPPPSEEPKNQGTKEPKEEVRAATPPAPLGSPPTKRVRAPRKPPSSEAMKAAELLSELLTLRGVSILRSNGYLAAWGREIDRLARDASDVRASLTPWLLIEAGIRWVCGPENSGQYALVVESGKSLREKWPRIGAAAERATRKSKPREAMDEWTRTGRVSVNH